jgi:hypothetical protein
MSQTCQELHKTTTLKKQIFLPASLSSNWQWQWWYLKGHDVVMTQCKRFNMLEHGSLSCDQVGVRIFGRTRLDIVHWPHSRSRSWGGGYSGPLLLLFRLLWWWQLVWGRNLEFQRHGWRRSRRTHGLQFSVSSLLKCHLAGILIHWTVLHCTVPRNDGE